MTTDDSDEYAVSMREIYISSVAEKLLIHASTVATGGRNYNYMIDNPTVSRTK